MKATQVLCLATGIILGLPVCDGRAASASGFSWDGTWTGVSSTGDPVTVTIVKGKVIGYSIRGASPYPVEYSDVTGRSILFGDRRAFTVRLTKAGNRVAYGSAHTSMGDGTAVLKRE